MCRTIAEKVFWEFDSIIMQNLSDILPIFCAPTWPSHHVSENQNFDKQRIIHGRTEIWKFSSSV